MLGQDQRLLNELAELGSDLCLLLSTLVPEDSEIVLDQFAALCDVLGGFHLVSCQHPNLDVGTNQVSDCFGNIVL